MWTEIMNFSREKVKANKEIFFTLKSYKNIKNEKI
jgi:hypothetical protein